MPILIFKVYRKNLSLKITINESSRRTLVDLKGGKKSAARAE